MCSTPLSLVYLCWLRSATDF
jgi:hypothetical protein